MVQLLSPGRRGRPAPAGRMSLTDLSATDLSARIATREVRPSEVMAEHLARVAALNPSPTG